MEASSGTGGGVLLLLGEGVEALTVSDMMLRGKGWLLTIEMIS